MSPVNIDFELLIKYLDGKASPDDAMRIEDWCAEDPEHRAYFDQLFETWTRDEAYRAPDARAALEAFRIRMPAAQTVWVASRRPFRRIAAVAAGILIPVLLGWYVWQMRSSVDYLTPDTVYIFRKDSVVWLAKGISVEVKPGSTLRYREGKPRLQVDFSGEGLWNITAEAKQKLSIWPSDTLRLEDIGTRFRLINRPDSVWLAVEEGLIAAYTATHTVQVAAGSRLVWKPGPVWPERANFSFIDAPLTEALATIRQVLGDTVQIERTDLKTAHLALNAYNMNTNEILYIVCATFSCSVRQDGPKHYTLY